jgi:hypothetical protein
MYQIDDDLQLDPSHEKSELSVSSSKQPEGSPRSADELENWEDLIAELDIGGSETDQEVIDELEKFEGTLSSSSRQPKRTSATVCDDLTSAASPGAFGNPDSRTGILHSGRNQENPRTSESAMAGMATTDFARWTDWCEGGPRYAPMGTSPKEQADIDANDTDKDEEIVTEPVPVGFLEAETPPTGEKLLSASKKPTRKHAVSNFRAAKFLRYLRDLNETAPSEDEVAALYRRYSLHSKKKKRAPVVPSLSEPLPYSEDCPSHLPAIPASIKILCAPARERFARSSHYSRRYRPWWDEKELPDHPSSGPRYVSPPQWRDIPDPLRVTLRHIALIGIAQEIDGSVFCFTLVASSDIQELVDKQANQIEWFRERVTRFLKRAPALGNPPFHLVQVHGERPRLILRGEIVAPRLARQTVEGALQKVAGPQSKPHFLFARPDNGWVNVLVKSCKRVGTPLCAGRVVDLRAKEIYEEWLPFAQA